MRKFLQVGGLIAGLVLIAFGIGAVYMGIDGRNQVRSDLAREQIVGTPDAGSVANKPINTGARAHAFAATMRKHTLEATKDQTYAQMGRFLDANGKPTNDATAAAKDPNGQPVENGQGRGQHHPPSNATHGSSWEPTPSWNVRATPSCF